MNLIEQLEKEQITKLARKKIPDFGPGDTVTVNVRVVEGDRTRVQAYEGVVIARDGGGIHESFTVRKISYGEGVERVFPIYSPLIDSIQVVRRGKVRRAKLYYLRGRRGKSARIPERIDRNRLAAAAAAKEAAKEAKSKGPLFKKPKGEPDDLTRIEGVDEALAEKLNKQGVTTFEQIAAFTDDDIAKIEDALQIDDQIERDDWIAKAQALMAEATAGEAVDAAAKEDAAEAEAAPAAEETEEKKD